MLKFFKARATFHLVKTAELRKLTKKQLDDKLAEARLELMKLEAKKALKTIEKPSQVKNTRKLVAKLLTLLKEKEQEAKKKAKPKKKPATKKRKAPAKAKTKKTRSKKAKANKSTGKKKK